MEKKKYIATIDLDSGKIDINLDELSLDQDSFRKLVVDNSKIFCTILNEYEKKYNKDDHKIHHLKKNMIDYLKY